MLLLKKNFHRCKKRPYFILKHFVSSSYRSSNVGQQVGEVGLQRRAGRVGDDAVVVAVVFVDVEAR